MNGWTDWSTALGALVGLVVVTALTRGSFILLPPGVQLPERVERALRYAPACALTAIVVPSVLVRDGAAYISLSNDRMWAVVAAGLVFTVRRNMLLMIGVGMAVFTALRLAG